MSVVFTEVNGSEWGQHSAMAHAQRHSDEMPVPYESATVADAMSRGVISCPPETPLRTVARMMATFGVHAIFVFERLDEYDERPRLWAVVSDLDLSREAAKRERWIGVREHYGD